VEFERTPSTSPYPTKFVAIRLDPDGTLDPTFGRSGIVEVDLTPNPDFALSVAIQTDGKLVLAGGADSAALNDRLGVIRLNPNGSLDTTFGFGGKLVSTVAHAASDVALQSDGKILEVSGGPGLTVTWITASGTLDKTFGGTGTVETDFPGTFLGQATSVAVGADGKIDVGGFVCCRPTNYDFALARYNPDGSLDTTFGTGGTVETDFLGGADEANDMALQSDGRILLEGSAETKTLNDLALARYTSSGALDPTFGNRGRVLTKFIQSSPSGGAGSDQEGDAVAIQSDGKILEGGTVYGYTVLPDDFALARHESSGVLDTSFGWNGKEKVNGDTTTLPQKSHTTAIAVCLPTSIGTARSRSRSSSLIRWTNASCSLPPM